MNSNQFPEQEPRYLEIAKRMQLIHLGDSAGVVYWQPAGMRLYKNLQQYIRRVHEDHGYLEVRTPSLVGLQNFAQSGHLAKYRDHLFLANQGNDPKREPDLQSYALRPMSCPNHIALYASARRSYRELPMALFEFGEVFRNEPSGSLQVLFRQRQFVQDDSHVFVTEDQVQAGVTNYLMMALRVYKELGFSDVQVAISLRPEQRFGEDALWDRAERGLQKACESVGLAHTLMPGEGAFYGPKVELGVRDKLGRTWQMGVVQLDYVLPERFGLQYVAADGQGARPVLLHHAVLGSLERMIGTLLETFGYELPSMLHPYPLVLAAVSEERHGSFARDVAQALRIASGHKLGLDVDDSSETVGAKVRKWKSLGARRVQLLGDREREQGVTATVQALLEG